MTNTDATPESGRDGAPVSRQWAREQRTGGRAKQAASAAQPANAPPRPPSSKSAPPTTSPASPRRPLGRGAVLVYALATVVFLAGLISLGWDGYRTSLKIKGGTSLEAEKDPTKPGYEAQVKPIPTHLLILTNDKGAATDAVVIAEGNAGKGGSVVVVPGVTVVARPEGNMNLSAFIAAKGVNEGITEIQRILTFAVNDSTTVTPKQWGELLSPLGSLTVANPSPLVRATAPGQKEVVYAAGDVALTPANIGDYVTFVSDGEAEINRADRVQAVFEAWLAALATKPAGVPTVAPFAAASGDRPVDVSALVTGLSQAAVAMRQLPTTAVPLPSANGTRVYLPDVEAIATMVPTVNPFPTSAFPGQRARTRILNGTTDSTAATRAAAPVVLAGGEITVLGNASKFGIATTTVVYHDPSMKDAAAKIGTALGVTATASPSQTEAYDVTVTLGSDFKG